ncbi:hypothetical protein RHGRI_008179 [Rhododendron griersonianum]|uniref:Uncharacterized protein n=1 Tax=Rhododendron griersonianum TaxID=479676 RepID=A0AAV6L1D2_9ERIC|nr:hypothetical protein RHGRI_008179 [Rhododendron griersonianum]
MKPVLLESEMIRNVEFERFRLWQDYGCSGLCSPPSLPHSVTLSHTTDHTVHPNFLPKAFHGISGILIVDLIQASLAPRCCSLLFTVGMQQLRMSIDLMQPKHGFLWYKPNFQTIYAWECDRTRMTCIRMKSVCLNKFHATLS